MQPPSAPAAESAFPAAELALEAERRTWPRDLAALALAAGASVLVLFLAWEGVEQLTAREDAARHRIHYARGISTSLLTAVLVVALATQQHRRRQRVLEAEVERRRGEAREARTLLQLVVDHTPASLVLLDEAYRVVQANEEARRVHGGVLEGLPCREALGGCQDTCRDCPAAESFSDGTSSRAPRAHTDPRTGEVLSIESHPFDHPDGRRFVLLVERVVTEQKKLQARLVHQEKMAAFGLLAAGVAHDLGNPLSSVEAQLQLLDEPALPRDAAPVIATVRQEVARLRRLLRELVDFARRRRDEATLVSVQSVVEDALRLVRHDRRMRRVALTTAFDAETPPVYMVEDHLMQVVLNLLLNALDAMPDGGALRVELSPAPGTVALRLHDSGVGMDRGVLARCFEPLFTTKPAGKGTGLGLSISRDILHAAGGGIELHSAPGHGTTAVVTLPAANAKREAA